MEVYDARSRIEGFPWEGAKEATCKPHSSFISKVEVLPHVNARAYSEFAGPKIGE